MLGFIFSVDIGIVIIVCILVVRIIFYIDVSICPNIRMNKAAFREKGSRILEKLIQLSLDLVKDKRGKMLFFNLVVNEN